MALERICVRSPELRVMVLDPGLMLIVVGPLPD